MTNADLKTRFLIGYEFIANNLAPGYTNDEISGFLNQGMDLLVDELYAANDAANLAEILVKINPSLVSFTTPPEDYGTYVGWAQCPSDFRWHVNSRAKIKRTEPFPVNYEWLECVLIDKREADKWTQTSINKPIIIYPKLIYHGLDVGFAFLYDSYSILDSVQVIYIKTPTRIDVTDGLSPELHPRLHQKIVDKAIALAMKATDVQRAQAEIQVNQAI